MGSDKPDSDKVADTDSIVVESEIPEYLLTLLNEIAVKEQFKEYSIKSTTGSNIGDGFQGVMLRVSIEGQRKTSSDKHDVSTAKLSLICKIPPMSEFRRQMSKGVFQKEVYTYDKILPALVKFQEEKAMATADAFLECEVLRNIFQR